MERRILGLLGAQPTTWLGVEEWQQSVLMSVNGTIKHGRGGGVRGNGLHSSGRWGTILGVSSSNSFYHFHAITL